MSRILRIQRVLAFLLAAAVALLMLMGNARAAEEGSPDALVKSTTDEVLTVMKQTSDRGKLLQLAEAKVVPHFDFKRMTQLAVGKSWSQANPEQQEQLEKEFRNLLVRTYTNSLTSGTHKNASVDYKQSRPLGGREEVVVPTLVKEPGRQPVAIDYHMEQTSGGWKVFDVVVENISLVTNYRSTFQTEVGKSGIDGLIKSIAEKNKSNDKAGGK